MFPIGNSLLINSDYVKNSLGKLLNRSTLDSLGYISEEEVILLNCGEVQDQFFIQVLPKNKHNFAFHNGQGVALFFSKKEQILESFIDLTVRRNIIPKVYLGFNNTPRITIPAFHLVKIGYYSKIIEAHLVELASANDSHKILGISEEEIASGLFGKVTQISI